MKLTNKTAAVIFAAAFAACAEVVSPCGVLVHDASIIAAMVDTHVNSRKHFSCFIAKTPYRYIWYYTGFTLCERFFFCQGKC